MKCSRYSVAIMCASRSEAMHLGEMEYRPATFRWYWPLHFALSEWPKGAVRFAWTFCPFCGGELPDNYQPPATGGCNGEWSDKGEGDE